MSRSHVFLPCGLFKLAAVGEAFHGKAIAAVANQPAGHRALVLMPMRLLCDPGNAYDPHAVKVMAGRRHIGFIPRELSQRVSSAIAAAPPGSIWAHGVIAGGLKLNGKQYSYSVELDIDLDTFEIVPDCPIPTPARQDLWYQAQSTADPMCYWTWMDQHTVADVAIGTKLEAWALPDWPNLNFYAQTKQRLRPGHRLISVLKSEVRRPDGSLPTEAVITAIDKRFAQVKIIR